MLGSLTTFILPSLVAIQTQLLNTDAVVPDSLLGLFATRQKLDGYEKMWHTCIYRPCWDELRVKVCACSSLFVSKCMFVK